MKTLSSVEGRIAAHIVQALRASGGVPPTQLKLQARLLGAAQQDLLTVDTHALTVEEAEPFAQQMYEAAQAMVSETHRSTTFALRSAGEGGGVFPECIFGVRLRDLVPLQSHPSSGFAIRRQDPNHVLEGELVENEMDSGYGGGGYGFNGEPPPTRHIASHLALHAVHALQANQELMISSARQQREADARELDNLRRRIAQLEADRDELVQLREDLLDRTQARELETQRTLERDAWVRSGLEKIVSIVALHSPQLLEHINKQMSPEQLALLLDIVRSTAAGKAAADGLQMGLLQRYKNGNGAAPPRELPKNGASSNGAATSTTAGDLASTVVSDGTTAVAAGGAFLFCCMVSEFLTGLRPKLVLVRGALDETQTAQLDGILKAIDDNQKIWVPVARAAQAKELKVVEGAKGAEPNAAEQKFFDLSVDFWTIIAKEPKALNKLKSAIPARALPLVDELAREFSFDKVESAAASPKN